jgi:hypothetical protein
MGLFHQKPSCIHIHVGAWLSVGRFYARLCPQSSGWLDVELMFGQDNTHEQQYELVTASWATQKEREMQWHGLLVEVSGWFGIFPSISICLRKTLSVE